MHTCGLNLKGSLYKEKVSTPEFTKGFPESGWTTVSRHIQESTMVYPYDDIRVKIDVRGSISTSYNISNCGLQ